MSQRKQKTIYDDLYEILELNVSDPIMFQGDDRKQQKDNEKNRQVMLVVPKENY